MVKLFARAFAAAALSIALAACATQPSGTPATPQATPTPPLTGDAARLQQYRTWIAEARRKHPYEESEARMYAVMMCESGGRPAAVNRAGPYTGLFQYVGRTWNDTWNIYRGDGILDPKAQIFATALAWHLNKQSHWGCYRKTATTP